MKTRQEDREAGIGRQRGRYISKCAEREKERWVILFLHL